MKSFPALTVPAPELLSTPAAKLVDNTSTVSRVMDRREEALSHQRPLSRPVAAFDRATQAYQKEKVLGSPEKDIRGPTHFKVVGAEVQQDLEA